MALSDVFEAHPLEVRCSLFLLVCLSVCLSVYPPKFLDVCIRTCYSYTCMYMHIIQILHILHHYIQIYVYSFVIFCISISTHIFGINYLPSYPSIHLSIHLSIHPSIYSPTHLSIHPSIHLSTCLSVGLSVCPFIYPSVCLLSV